MPNLNGLKKLASQDGNKILEHTTVESFLNSFDVGRISFGFGDGKNKFLDSSRFNSPALWRKAGLRINDGELEKASKAINIDLACFLRAGNPYLEYGEQIEILTQALLKLAKNNGIKISYK